MSHFKVMARWSVCLLGAITIIGSVHVRLGFGNVSKTSAPPPPPRVFLSDAKALANTKESLRRGNGKFRAAIAKLDAEAKQALTRGPFSVVDKSTLPPSGDKHDYMSLGPYWWPNPKSPNGLPYIRRDGEVNPERKKFTDHANMEAMIDAVETLALAAYLKDDESYAERATKLLRVWFIERETRMNPNLNYGQAIPGITQGRGIGIIETHSLPRVVDAVGLLRDTKAWTTTDQKGMEQWFTQYLTWLLESPHGKDEAGAKNNHGTWYDVQVASFALFVGNDALAKKVLRESMQKRIAALVEPDGRQPSELVRTNALGYSFFNLRAMFQLASLGENVGLDLWNFRTSDGRSIRAALDWLLPFASGEKEWPYKQITKWDAGRIVPLLCQAAVKFKEGQYEAMAAKIAGAKLAADRVNLLFPMTKV